MLGQIIFYDRNKIELFHLTKETSSNSTLTQLPYPLIASTLLSEDERYFTNSSLDYIALLRAIKERLFNESFSSGASTISQQTSRALLGITRSRTTINKLEDILTASFLENNYSKHNWFSILRALRIANTITHI